MVGFRSKKNRRTGRTTRYPVNPGEAHRRQIEEEDARMPREMRDVMSPGRCDPENVTVQPPISITVVSGEGVRTQSPTPEPTTPAVAVPVVPKKSSEYPAASLNGAWDVVEPELYKMFDVVNVKKAFARGKATVEMADGTKLVYHRKKDNAGNVHWTRREKDIITPTSEDSDSDDSDEETESFWD